MTMTAVALGIVLLSGYIWLTRGFFSALLHLACVLAAGAIAFGVWEPLAYLILGKIGDRGTVTYFGDAAWGLSLGLPFAIALGVLRGVTDAFLPANAQCAKGVDFAAGGVCGVLSGIIVAGFTVLSIGFLRGDATSGGYQLVLNAGTSQRGSIERDKSMFKPWVDEITAGLYSHMSLTSMRTGSPLAVWHPDFATVPSAMRLTYENVSRTTMKPEAARLVAAYTVGNVPAGGPMSALLTDGWSVTPQKIADFHGESISSGYLAGYTFAFNSTARERDGYISVGNGQVRLVVQDEDGNSVPLHPIASVTRQNNSAEVAYQRFRFDSDKAFVASVTGASEATIAFEFAVPARHTPIAIYVKGVRFEPTGTPVKFATPSQRDEAIHGGQLAEMGGVGPIIDPNTGAPVETPQQQTSIDENPVVVSGSIGFTIQKGQEGSLETEEGDRGHRIRDGEQKISRKRLGKATDPKLQIRNLAFEPGSAIVQVNFTPMRRTSAFGQALSAAENLGAPALVDINGQVYEAVGFIYEDSENVHIRYTRGSTIRSMNELPSVGSSDPSRSIKLIFVTSNNIEIRELRIGGKVIETYDPPKKIEFVGR